MIERQRLLWIAGMVAAVLGVFGIGLAYRANRVWRVASDMKTQVRYLIEHGGTIGEAPASTTFSPGYLRAIFGDNPELLAQLEAVIQRGLQDTPALNLGEVAAMVVTYRKKSGGEIEDVGAHVVGGFPLGKRRLGMHRDGYLRYLVDSELWDWGNTIIGFLGRDMVLFAAEEAVETQHQILDAVLSGDIMPLVTTLVTPLYFTAVLPDPRRIIPGQLRKHVQAVVVKGHLAMHDGHWETIVLTASPKSARYAKSVLSDLKIAAEIGLKTKWKGVVRQTEWGPVIDPWWAYELVQTSEKTAVEQEGSIVRMHSEFGRVMVNVVLKGIERMGRDLAQMRGSLEEKLDPRLVDAQLQARKPLHYWSDPHRWGPNWPIPPTDAELELARAKKEAEAAAAAKTAADQSEAVTEVEVQTP